MMNFFICSVGEPKERYFEENFKRCIDFNGHFMYKDTTHKGVYSDVKKGDIIFLRYADKLNAFGLVEKKENIANPLLGDWNYAIYVSKWYFHDDANKKKGVTRNGIQSATIAGDQFATIKQISKDYAIDKMIAIVNGKNNELLSFVKRETAIKSTISAAVNLLTANYNLILTGAPGTGKTYLAKQIAQEIISHTKHETPIQILNSAIEQFHSNPEEVQQYQTLLKEFQEKFPKEELQNLTLEDYCIGNSDENKDNFCYWIERKLKPLGYYFPGSSKTYLLYWSKSEEKYMVSGYLKGTHNDPNVLMKLLASDIHTLVNDKDPDSFTSKFGESFILKVLNSYYPDEFAPINSRKHIDNVISLFDIHLGSNNIFEKNKAIYQFYREQCKDKNITIFEFMSILYRNFNIKDGEVIENGEMKTIGEVFFVQFHPSYDYTDFVEGLRPIKEKEQKEIGFARKDGIFKELCNKAKKNPHKNYVLIVDEINRGEISKIFGELFFSIDPGYRGEKGKVKTQYQNLIEEGDEFYDGFYVPENVYIIGTMNDIDRSVESMDFAFRRRFAFKEITAKDSQAMLDSKEAWGKDKMPKPDFVQKVKDKMDAINKVIFDEEKKEGIEGLSAAYHIGASYFLKLANYRNVNGEYVDTSFTDLWENHLEGLLFEYMRGMVDVPKKMKRLAEVFGYSNLAKYE